MLLLQHVIVLSIVIKGLQNGLTHDRISIKGMQCKHVELINDTIAVWKHSEPTNICILKLICRAVSMIF
jgi:hypothetical protein